jgi:hypothetical protein
LVVPFLRWVMASVGEFTVLISRVGYTMARTPLGVLGDFLLRTCLGDDDGMEGSVTFFFLSPPLFDFHQGMVNATKKIVLSIFLLILLRLASIVSSLYVFLVVMELEQLYRATRECCTTPSVHVLRYN